jgi:chromate transport protein ChrA
VGLAFVAPSFLMVLALSWLYVAFGGLPWMQALFYGIGAVVIAIIAVAAYRLARGANKRDPVLWGIFGVMLVATVWAQAELAALFILAGLLVMAQRAWPGLRGGLLLIAAGALGILGLWGLETFLLGAETTMGRESVLTQILMFFSKAGAFVFGSGLAIVPFFPAGLPLHHRPRSMVPASPGKSATASVCRRGNRRREWRHRWSGGGARTAGDLRLPDGRDWLDRPGAPVAIPTPGTPARGRGWYSRPRGLAHIPWRLDRANG